MSILFAILLFSLLIFLHELGHFVAAKAFGVQVNEFAMFMGPAIVKWKRGETQYSIRCIPIGGYCAMEGEDDNSDSPRSFAKAKWWKRMIILLAGVTMNFVAGLLIFAIICLPGKEVSAPVITDFTDCCVFNTEQGLQVGDEILELDGEKIYINSDISLILTLNQTKTHDITVLRNGKELEFKNFEMAHTHKDEKGADYLHYGFQFGEIRKANLWDKMVYTWHVTIDNVRTIRISLEMLFTGKAGLKDLTGPIGIVQVASDAASASKNSKEAFQNVMYLGGFLAINLAVMNLLPIPALDGGRVAALLITMVIEKITGKKLDPKYEAYVHAAGMVLLLGLMAVIFMKDIIMIFKG